MKRQKRLLPVVVASALGSAVLASLLVDEGWLLWIPVVLALVALTKVKGMPRR
jgi:hypothetical protein